MDLAFINIQSGSVLVALIMPNSMDTTNNLLVEVRTR